jgi:hypothetical protein
MSWIRKHWEAQYISDAEEKIRRTVRDFPTLISYAQNDSPNLHKMREYRDKMSSSAGESTSVPQGTDSTEDMPMYMSLADQYGIADEMEIGESSATMQTIEQEYQAYITAVLSLKTVNILKFWEVGG